MKKICVNFFEDFVSKGNWKLKHQIFLFSLSAGKIVVQNKATEDDWQLNTVESKHFINI